MTQPRGGGDIRVVCPGCGLAFPAVAGITDVAARQALDKAIGRPDRPGLPDPVLRRLLSYLALHAPAGRALQWPKAARLIEELVELVGKPSHRRDGGPERLIRPSDWASAMDEADSAALAGKLALPLDGHGWLTTVAYRAAARSQDQAERTAESRQRGETPVGSHPSHRPAVVPQVPRKGTPAGLTSLANLLGHPKPPAEED